MCCGGKWVPLGKVRLCSWDRFCRSKLVARHRLMAAGSIVLVHYTSCSFLHPIIFSLAALNPVRGLLLLLCLCTCCLCLLITCSMSLITTWLCLFYWILSSLHILSKYIFHGKIWPIWLNFYSCFKSLNLLKEIMQNISNCLFIHRSHIADYLTSRRLPSSF